MRAKVRAGEAGGVTSDGGLGGVRGRGGGF